MNLPGFSADASLRPAAGRYRQHVQLFSAGVTPSMQNRGNTTGSCGTCTPVRWPNGTKTGSCVQECCDANGNCTSKSCTCPAPERGRVAILLR